MNDLMYNGLIFGLLCMIFYTPVLLCNGVLNLSAMDRDDIKFKPISLIPIVNTIYAEYSYFGKIGFTTIMTIINLIVIPLRLGIWYFAYSEGTLAVVTMYAVLIALTLLFLANCVLVFIILKDSNTLEMWKVIGFALFFPVGQWYIGKCLGNTIRHINKLRATFQG